ncbi:Methyl-accepting chemotaxis serine transducer [Burkholderia multivorans]
MKWLNALTVGKRLTFLIAVAAAGLLSIAAAGLLQMNHVYDTAGFAQVNVVPSLLVLDKAQASFADIRAQTYRSLLETDATKRNDLLREIGEKRAVFDRNLKEYEPLLADQKDKDLLADDRARMAEFDTARGQLLSSLAASDSAPINVGVLKSFIDTAQTADESLMNHRAYNVKLADEAAAEARTTMTSARFTLSIMAIATLAIVIALGTWMTRTLRRQLGAEPGNLVEVATQIANGDLTAQMNVQANDRASVLFAVKTMRDGLTDIVKRVQLASNAIATGSSEIASGNQDLSSRTEEQAASLEETAASMEELTATVRQNTDNAQQASTLSNNASDVVRQGSEAVDRMVSTMTDISDNSSRVADITGIIEGIAFQTNILALNAAVEAARAGEQGRGFAVVASEVRSLAQRSSSAAKEIKELIATSVQKIQDGSSLAGNAGKTMTEVTRAITRVTDIIGEIASASIEQSRGIEQVNQAITQMDEVTQQNAALVEEAAAASKSLEEQGSKLTEAVAFFKVDRAQAPISAPAQASAQLQRAPAVGKTQRVSTSSSRRKPAEVPMPAAAPALNAASDPEWNTF